MTAAEDRLQRLATDLAPQLLNYLVRRVDPVEDAADLLSETLLVMCRRTRALPSDDHEARLWAFGVARRVLATHRRGAARRAALVDRLRDDLQNAVDEPATGQEAMLLEAVGALDPLDQEIIRLIHWDGFSQVEVARILHRRPGTIRSRYARARETLKAQLHDRPKKTPAGR
ncbi:RNA polymerase sigma factor [Leekyejoonella antrihumi]|uniref:RNA polymerase sigma factor n=1 Tax=Leekyejoonella antrihumi TaxID=1660198 RepID=UPI0016453E97|nr:sigma-70 family RNA polymerase sigma factor [Leekyejoonella antrihumi]